MAIGTPVLMKETSVDLATQATLAHALTTGASAGSLVIVVGSYGLGSSPTITCADNSGAGNVYTVASRADRNVVQTPHSYIIYSILTGALTTSHTVTVSFSPSVNGPAGGVFGITGVAAVPLDQVNNGTGQSTTPSSGNITTTQADEILIGSTATGIPQTITLEGTWTRLGNHLQNSFKALDSGYKIVSSTGTYVYDGTVTSCDWAASIASFKADTAAPGNLAPVIYGRGAC